MPYYSESAQYWYRVKKVGVDPARSRKSCIVQAVRQVVFTDVLIVGGLDVDGQSFAPIGSHKIDSASDWLLTKRLYIGMKGLPGVQIPSNVLSSTYFLGKTFFFSKIILGDPPLIFLEVCLKFRSMER